MGRLTNRHNPNVSIDARGFDKMIEELMRYTGKDFKEIIAHEAARTLEGAVKRTNPDKKESLARIKRRFTYSGREPISKKVVGYVNVEGKRVRVRTQKPKGASASRGRGKARKRIWVPGITNPKWRPLQKELKRLMAKKLKSVGMSKGTWVYIAKRAKLPKLGGKNVPKYVHAASMLLSPSLKAKLNGSAANVGKHNWVVTMKNFGTVPMIRGGRRRGADGFAAFRRAMKGREDYFKTNLSKGVFEKTKTISRKYKGLMVTDVQNPKSSDRVD